LVVSPLADEVDDSSIADDNELTTAFHQMKTACHDFLDKIVTSDLSFHIANSPPDHATTDDGLCIKDIIDSGLRRQIARI
jgi:hypothetical protein